MRSLSAIVIAHPTRKERRFVRQDSAAGLGSAVAGRTDDLRLFTVTFAAGFLFVSLFIA